MVRAISKTYIAVSLGCLLLNLYAVPASAQLYDYEAVGIRSTAMGGTGIAAARDGEASYFNPALLGFSRSFSIGIAGQIREERVKDPAYFNGIASSGTDLGFHQLSVVAPIPVWNQLFTLGLSYSRPMNPILYRDDWEGAPMILAPAVGINFADRFFLGASYYLWRGSISRPEPARLASPDYPAPVDNVTYEGSNLSFGFAARFLPDKSDHSLIFAGSLRTAPELHSDGAFIRTSSGSNYSSRSSSGYGVGRTAAIGLAWSWYDRTTVAVDMEWRDQQGDMADEDEYRPSTRWLANDSWQFRTGAEYVFDTQLGATPARAGYRYSKLPLKDSSSDPVMANALTAGIGLVVEWITFELGYEWEWYDQTIYAFNHDTQQLGYRTLTYNYNTVLFGITYTHDTD